MRRLLALGCCAVFLVFGFAPGMAHVHESADHHEKTGGLHLDHAHLHHGPAGHHAPVLPADTDDRVDARHVGHHDGDAVYRTAKAVRSFDSAQRVMPATLSSEATIDPSSLNAGCSDDLPGPWRGPPRKDPTGPRAPPA